MQENVDMVTGAIKPSVVTVKCEASLCVISCYHQLIRSMSLKCTLFQHQACSWRGWKVWICGAVCWDLGDTPLCSGTWTSGRLHSSCLCLSGLVWSCNVSLTAGITVHLSQQMEWHKCFCRGTWAFVLGLNALFWCGVARWKGERAEEKL